MEQQEEYRVANPFPAPAAPAGGAVVQVESQRAVAEVLAAMQIARKMPRDQRAAMDQILNDCSMIELAEEATYDYSRGGTSITGPSIRLLETISRRWGNLECGVQELGRNGEYSEVRTYAVDLETGFRDTKTFQVRHWRDTKKGGYLVKDERDIYEIIANYAARRKRACLEAIIPPDVKEAAIRQCEVTLKSKVEITPDLIRKTLEWFSKYGVTQEMIEKRIQRRMDAMTPGHAVNLKKIMNSLKEEMSQPQDWFDMGQATGGPVDGGAPQGASKTSTLAAELAARKPKAEPEPQPQAEQQQKPAEPEKKKAPETIAQRADPETGEITNESVRAAIQRAGAQEALQPILMDIMRLPPGTDRDETMKLWNARVMGLKDGTAGKAAPVKEAKPKMAKPHGTTAIKQKLIEEMNAAKTDDALDQAADKITHYAWDGEDKTELEQRYTQCKADLL